MYAFLLVVLTQPTPNRVRQVHASLILVASEDMVRKHHDVAVRDTMVSSPIHGPACPRQGGRFCTLGQSRGLYGPTR